MSDLSREAQITRAQKYIQRQMNYAQRQLNYPQRNTQQYSKIHCPYIEQKRTCDADRQKPEHCKNCLVWEWQQFQKMKPLTTRK